MTSSAALMLEATDDDGGRPRNKNSRSLSRPLASRDNAEKHVLSQTLHSCFMLADCIRAVLDPGCYSSIRCEFVTATQTLSILYAKFLLIYLSMVQSFRITEQITIKHFNTFQIHVKPQKFLGWTTEGHCHI